MPQTGESLTYAELNDRISQFVHALRGSGVPPKGRIAILLKNQIEYPVILLGARLGGFDHLPLNTHISVDDLTEVLDFFHPDVVVVSDEFGDKADELAQRLDPEVRLLMVGEPRLGWLGFENFLAGQPTASFTPGDHGLLMLLSGGSTGRPKIVARPPTTTGGVSMIAHIVFDENAVALVTSPLYHTMGLMWLVNTIMAGGHAVVLGKWNSEDALRAVQDYRVTMLSLVPTMMVRLLNLPDDVRKRYDLSSLVAVTHGAGPCPQHVKDRFYEWIPCTWEMYGMTEGFGATAISAAEARERPGSVGRPIDGYRVVIRDEDGNELPPNTVGIVWFIRTDGTRMQYLGQPSETAASYNKHGEGTAWDMGYVDPDGYLYLAGRKKNMIIVGGYNVFPSEVEKTLHTHPAVSDVCVVGVEDAEYGEVPVALVQLHDPARASKALADELSGLCHSKLGGLMRPRRVTFVDGLPRTETGKLDFRAAAALAR